MVFALIAGSKKFTRFHESLEKSFQVSCAVTDSSTDTSRLLCRLKQMAQNSLQFLFLSSSVQTVVSVSWGPNFISISNPRRCPPVWDTMIQLSDLLFLHNDKQYVNTLLPWETEFCLICDTSLHDSVSIFPLVSDLTLPELTINNSGRNYRNELNNTQTKGK